MKRLSLALLLILSLTTPGLSQLIHDFSADFKVELLDKMGKALVSQDCTYIFNRDLKIMGTSREKKGPFSLILGVVRDGTPPFGKIKPGLELKYWCEPLLDFKKMKSSQNESIEALDGKKVDCHFFKGDKVAYWKKLDGHLVKAEIKQNKRHWRFTFGNFAVNTGAGQKLANILKKQQEKRRGMIGSPAPDVAALTLDGRKAKPTDFKGKVLVLDFISYGSKPCRRGLKGMKLLSLQYPETKFVIVSIDPKPDELAQFINKEKMKLTVLHDKARNLLKHYAIKKIPHIVLIDQKGIVKWRGHPAEPEFKENLDKLSGR